jgi:hypothetical protein
MFSDGRKSLRVAERGEIMSLKEKAKTLVQIIRENCVELYNLRCRDCIGQCEFENSESFAGKWVRVEDAEEALLDRLIPLEQEVRMLQKERLELKQKLQQLSIEFPLHTLYPISDEIFLRLQAWYKKFEELLKEEEANPNV